MEQILTAAKNIAMFVLVFSLVTSVFSGTKYGRFFRMMEGILILVLILTPFMAWFQKGESLPQHLEDDLLQIQTEFDERQLQEIGERREQLMEKQMGGETEHEER